MNPHENFLRTPLVFRVRNLLFSQVPIRYRGPDKRVTLKIRNSLLDRHGATHTLGTTGILEN